MLLKCSMFFWYVMLNSMVVGMLVVVVMWIYFGGIGVVMVVVLV